MEHALNYYNQSILMSIWKNPLPISHQMTVHFADSHFSLYICGFFNNNMIPPQKTSWKVTFVDFDSLGLVFTGRM